MRGVGMHHDPLHPARRLQHLDAYRRHHAPGARVPEFHRQQQAHLDPAAGLRRAHRRGRLLLHGVQEDQARQGSTGADGSTTRWLPAAGCISATARAATGRTSGSGTAGRSDSAGTTGRATCSASAPRGTSCASCAPGAPCSPGTSGRVAASVAQSAMVPVRTGSTQEGPVRSLPTGPSCWSRKRAAV